MFLSWSSSDKLIFFLFICLDFLLKEIGCGASRWLTLTLPERLLRLIVPSGDAEVALHVWQDAFDHSAVSGERCLTTVRHALVGLSLVEEANHSATLRGTCRNLSRSVVIVWQNEVVVVELRRLGSRSVRQLRDVIVMHFQSAFNVCDQGINSILELL